MNWLIIGPISRPHHTAWSIIRALHSLKEEVFAIESRQWNTETTAILATSTIKSRKIDYVLMVDTNPEIFELIPKSKNYAKIFWSFEFDPKFFQRIKLTVNLSDFFFSMCPKIAQENKKLCNNSFFLPQAADHFLYKPLEALKKQEYNISFVGTPKLGRIERLEALKRFNIHAFGEHWHNTYNFPTHNAVYAQDFNELCAKSKIMLNLSCYKNFETPERTISQRIFMIMATKSFCLTEPIEGLDYFFDKNEIESSYDTNSIDYYLKHDKPREEIAENGYRRIVQCHTYIHRMKEMIKILQS